MPNPVLASHRDIKPGNVLVDPMGTLKLIDFGIARPLDRALQTENYRRFLTLANAAPEQLRSDPPGTGGVLLYELLSGAHPFLEGGPSLGELERCILNGHPRPPSQAIRSSMASPQTRGFTKHAAWAAQLRGDLDTIVLTSLQTDPACRYSGCSEFAAYLNAWLEALPVRARAGGTLYRVHRFVQRHWLGLATGSLITGTAVVFCAVVSAWHSARERAEQGWAQAQASSDFLQQLFTESNPRRTASAALSARDLLVRGMETLRLDGRLSDAQRVQLLHTVAEAFLGIGDHVSAAQAVALAQVLAQSAAIPTDPLIAAPAASAQARARRLPGGD